MRVAAVALCLVLAGCGHSSVEWRVDASRPAADASLLTECPAIPRLTKPASMGDLLEHGDMVVGLYEECATANGAKARYIKGLSGRNVD